MIGVIGGNGVAATNKLCSLIEEKLTTMGAYRDCHHPEMIIWQATKAPSRSMFLEGRGPSWVEDYITIGKKLKDCGCSKICMCCNTAHYAIDILEKEVGLPFINLLELVAKECQKRRLKKVGLMCSDGLRKVELYDSVFKKIDNNIKLVYPDDKHQKLVTLGICNSKNKSRFTDVTQTKEHPNNCFYEVYRYLIDEEKCDSVVGGCTDIRNVFSPDNTDGNYVDSLEVLADALIEEYNIMF